MIVELIRKDLFKFNYGNIQPPKDITKALVNFDKRLELIWNDNEKQWEIYRVKFRSVDGNTDLLLWQVSVPKGILTISIITWLKKLDTSQRGYVTDDERSKVWLAQYKERQYIKKENEYKQKQEENYYYSNNVVPFMSQLLMSHKPRYITVPPVVGVSPAGKPIRAYKKQTKLERKLNICQ